MGDILAIDLERKNNAELIRDCAELGYLRSEWRTLDPTWGEGAFWKLWKPRVLVKSDLNPAKSPGRPADFTNMDWPDASFDAVVFDPPYKLNGTPTATVGGPDERYGVDEVKTWQDRMALCRSGQTECLRVLKPGGMLLMKCQDQVCSRQVRWQTVTFTNAGEVQGARLVDMLHLVGGRAQPDRGQKHARHNYSTMLVFKKN